MFGASLKGKKKKKTIKLLEAVLNCLISAFFLYFVSKKIVDKLFFKVQKVFGFGHFMNFTFKTVKIELSDFLWVDKVVILEFYKWKTLV